MSDKHQEIDTVHEFNENFAPRHFVSEFSSEIALAAGMLQLRLLCSKHCKFVQNLVYYDFVNSISFSIAVNNATEDNEMELGMQLVVFADNSRSLL